MGKGAWRPEIRETAANRAARRGLQRNAAISAGAEGDAHACRRCGARRRVAEPGSRTRRGGRSRASATAPL
jgi:hypothetical protein